MHTQAKLDLVFFDAGGGHRAAATALESIITDQRYPWNVRLVNLQEVLDPLDVFRKVSGVRLQDLYNRMLANGWTLGASSWLPMMQWIIRRYHKGSVRLLAEFWKERKPDMVVSLVPNLNRALFQALEQVSPGAPYVTILTDLADYPPHFWMERQRQYLICGTERAHEQAVAMGYEPWQVRRVSGMILRPVFYRPRTWDRHEERRKLGLDPELPTGLVIFGGEGSKTMLHIARRLGQSQISLQLIMICGKSEKLRARLAAMTSKNKIVAVGFTKEVPRFMAISDFFVGKPGPGSISEALQMGLPVIVERNAWTLPQERYNAAWIREHGYGKVLRNFRQIEGAVRDLLEAGGLEKLKARVAGYQNRALFEIPPILSEILERHRG